MPIYEYECNKCGRIEEVVQKISDNPLVECKYCSGKLHKIISQSTFHLKGSGWYVTDYAAGSKASSAKNSHKSTSKSTKSTNDKAS